MLMLLQGAAPKLSTSGWVFMIASNLFVWGFALRCFMLVLRPPVTEPPDPVKDFHSA